MKKRALLYAFELYSWITNLIQKFANLCPPLLHHAIIFLMLRGGGKNLGIHTFIDYDTWFRYPSKIRIGSYVSVNRGCRFIASWHYPEVKIVIGDHAVIAPETIFLAASHDYTRRNLPDTAASIHVGDYVWIGARSIILPGVTIGEGAVVGAGSIVTRDVPPYTVVAGNPARILKKRELRTNADQLGSV